MSELKIRRRRDSTTADLVEGVWGEVAVAMARKIEIGDKKRRLETSKVFICEDFFMIVSLGSFRNVFSCSSD